MKRGLPAAVALVVAANIVVLAGVAYNRSRVVERIELTEFELGQNYAGADNSGISLRFEWTQGSWPYQSSWLSEEKLK